MIDSAKYNKNDDIGQVSLGCSNSWSAQLSQIFKGLTLPSYMNLISNFDVLSITKVKSLKIRNKPGSKISKHQLLPTEHQQILHAFNFFLFPFVSVESTTDTDTKSFALSSGHKEVNSTLVFCCEIPFLQSRRRPYISLDEVSLRTF